MNWSKLSTFILIFPFLLAGFLSYKGFSIDTDETLKLFLSLVWGVLVALGGGFFYISKVDFTKQRRRKQFMKDVSERIQGAALAILLHTSIFVLLSFLYPIRSYVSNFVGKNYILKFNLSHLYDSLLYVEIIIPTLASVLIGVWCILLVINQDG